MGTADSSALVEFVPAAKQMTVAPDLPLANRLARVPERKRTQERL